MLETRERTRGEVDTALADEIRALEELWAAPPEAGEIGPGVGRRVVSWLEGHLGMLIAAGWLAFLASTYFQPVPDPESTTPFWSDVVIAGLLLALGVAGITGLLRSRRLGLAAATIAGGFGIALAIGCRATEHHLGAWWLYELGATAALTSLAALGLARSKR